MHHKKLEEMEDKNNAEEKGSINGLVLSKEFSGDTSGGVGEVEVSMMIFCGPEDTTEADMEEAIDKEESSGIEIEDGGVNWLGRSFSFRDPAEWQRLRDLSQLNADSHSQRRSSGATHSAGDSFVECSEEEKKRKELEKTVEERVKQIIELKKKLVERDNCCSDLEKRIDRRKKRVTDLERTVGQRDSHVSELEKIVQELKAPSMEILVKKEQDQKPAQAAGNVFNSEGTISCKSAISAALPYSKERDSIQIETITLSDDDCSQHGSSKAKGGYEGESKKQEEEAVETTGAGGAHVSGHQIWCTECEHVFKDQELLDIHLKIYGTQHQFRCDKCDRVFPTTLGLSRHQKAVHQIHSTQFGCSSCNYKFATEYARDIHQGLYHAL